MENNITTPKFSPIKVWTPGTIGWLTLFCGFLSGFILATINWLRMGYTRKALLHLPVGIVLAGLDIFILRDYYIGHLRSDMSGLSSTQFIIRILINLGIIFAFVAYFHKVTAKDIQRLEGFGNAVEKRGIFQAIIIAVIVGFCFSFLNSFVGVYRLVSMQNHVYCELLQPGLTSTQVSDALMEIGPHHQFTASDALMEIAPPHHQFIYDDKFPKKEVDTVVFVLWGDFYVELKNNLRLSLGYDKNNKLVWISRKYTGKDHSKTSFETIECPWTIRNMLYN